MDKVSIIIRTLNEKDNLSCLFRALAEQDFDGETEVFVVDNESVDGTQALAKKMGATVLTIRKDDFSYPKSMNLGLSNCRFPIVLLTVGHALPISKKWITSALRHFDDPEVVGVYSPVIPNKKHTMSESLLYWPGYLISKIRSPYSVKRSGIGVFGATNIAIRKTAWERHKFQEKYGMGGEDMHWAEWAIANGCKIVCDTDFVVRHSHHLDFFGIISQIKYWRKLKKPTKFSKKELFFRKDLKL